MCATRGEGGPYIPSEIPGVYNLIVYRVRHVCGRYELGARYATILSEAEANAAVQTYLSVRSVELLERCKNEIDMRDHTHGKTEELWMNDPNLN